MNLTESIRRYYEQLQPKYITWDFYEKYIDIEPPFGQLGLPVFLRTYSRHIESEKRREKYMECVLRNVEFSIGLDGVTSYDELKKEAQELFDYIFNLRTFPSGRALWTAGSKQTEADPSSIWNCTFRTIDSISSYGEIFYWLLIGAGCGYSVEKEYISQLPSFNNTNKTVKHVNTVNEDWVYGEDYTSVSFEGKYTEDLKDREYLVGEETVYEDLINECVYFHNGNVKNVEIIVGDSKEGWVVAQRLYLFLLKLDNQLTIIFNYSRVRPAGVVLKRFGGVATGCKNFVRMIDQINFILKDHYGKINSEQAMDMVGITALCVVSGNIRRSATIALGDSDDNTFKNVKYDLWSDPEKEPYRQFRVMSNNSVVVDEKLELRELVEVFEKIKSNGEPGLYIRGNARKYDECIIGTNPCFAAGTMVMTRDGHYPIEELVGKTVEVYDGNQWIEINNFRVTGENQEVWEMTLHSGQKIKATPYHTFILENGERVKFKDLQVGDHLAHVDVTVHGDIHVEGAYLKGFMLGDGSTEKSRAALSLYQPKEVCMSRLETSLAELPVGKISTNGQINIGWKDNNSKRQIRKQMQGITVRDTKREVYKFVTEYRNGLPDDVLNWDYMSKCEFIAGLFDADGCALDSKNGFGYQLTSVSLKVLEDLQCLLKTLGVNSKIQLNRKAGFVDFGEERGGVCKVKTAYRITIAQESAITLSNQVVFSRLKSFSDRETKYKVKTNFYTIADIKSIGIFDKVYCCTVHTNNSFTLSNGMLVGQCVETGLLNQQSCNLTTNNVLAFVKCNENGEYYLDEPAWRKSLYLSTRIGSRVTTLPQWHPEWDKVQKSQRLLGVSMTGLMDAADALGWSEEEMEDFFHRSRLYVREVADEYHAKLGIERSARVSCVKPEGSVSQLPTVSSGVHRGYAPQFTRRVRFSSVDPLAKALLDVFGEDNVFPENGQGEYRQVITTEKITKKELPDWLIKLSSFGGLMPKFVFNYLINKYGKDVDETVEKVTYVKRPTSDLYGLDQNGNPVDTWVFSFPIKTQAKIRAIDESAISQLERYKLAQMSYTADGHNTSITVTVAPDEWDDVIIWVYQNWDCVIGVSFLPKYDPEKETYPQMPYEPCSVEKYEELKAITPTFTENELIALIAKYEDKYDEYEILEDACASGSCPLR